VGGGAKAPATDDTIAGANWSDRDISGETHSRIAFVDTVVPLLQERGVLRTEYETTTLRGHLGLPAAGVIDAGARVATA